MRFMMLIASTIVMLSGPARGRLEIHDITGHRGRRLRQEDAHPAILERHGRALEGNEHGRDTRAFCALAGLAEPPLG
jgi:hypothetical protein